MARPKKEPDITKLRSFTMRLPITQYEVWCEEAKTAGLSVSDYVRKSMSNNGFVCEYKIVRNSEELQAIAKGLWKIGNNLNQISRYFNQHGASTPEIENEILSSIREIHKIGLDLDALKKR